MPGLQLEPVYRITVFAPEGAVGRLLASIRRITPLGDARYDSVHWVIRDCREYFRPLPGSEPARGKPGELHEEPSVMLVFAIPRDAELLQKVIDEGIRPAHPWESPSIFVDESFYPLP